MIQENISLKNYNTFRTEATARYFVEVSNLEELRKARNFAKEKGLNILPLGGGSNIFFTKDFDGLVIFLNLKGIEVEMEKDTAILKAWAGENWHETVLKSLEMGLGGMENLALIPGNVGTCPVQNIGAYGVEISDIMQSCQVYDTEEDKVKEYSVENCQFGYRHSIFKTSSRGKIIIISVSFRLTRNHHIQKVDYGVIQEKLRIFPTPHTPLQIASAVMDIRSSKLPDPKKIGNAGSFFKNPTVSDKEYLILKEKFPNIQGYHISNGVKLAAGWLIEQCGWKGKRLENVGTWENQALVIINVNGKATGKEIFNFSEKIIQSVKEKYGIVLEREVNVI